MTPQTQIEQEHGRLEVGTYVEIKGRSDGRKFTAHKAEVKRSHCDVYLQRERAPADYAEALEIIRETADAMGRKIRRL